MDFQVLKTFKAVVEAGGIVSASRELNTVQSNVTARIKRLEDDLGVSLFYRKGRGVELSQSGRVLFEYAQKLLHLERQARAAVRDAGDSTGEIRIGSMETFAALKLPKALKKLRAETHGVALHVETETSAALIKKVLDFQLDCAFVGGPIEHPELVAIEVQQEELVHVRSREAHGSDNTLILFREGCVYRSAALAWQRDTGDQLGDVMEFGTLDGILGCVAMGIGSTLMPAWVIEASAYRDAVITAPVPKAYGAVSTFLIYHRNTVPMAAFAVLASAVQSSPISMP